MAWQLCGGSRAAALAAASSARARLRALPGDFQNAALQSVNYIQLNLGFLADRSSSCKLNKVSRSQTRDPNRVAPPPLRGGGGRARRRLVGRERSQTSGIHTKDDNLAGRRHGAALPRMPTRATDYCNACGTIVPTPPSSPLALCTRLNSKSAICLLRSLTRIVCST